jgi:hypothetical protein
MTDGAPRMLDPTASSRAHGSQLHSLPKSAAAAREKRCHQTDSTEAPEILGRPYRVFRIRAPSSSALLHHPLDHAPRLNTAAVDAERFEFELRIGQNRALLSLQDLDIL